MTDSSSDVGADDFEDEIGAEGNRITGARSVAVAEYVTRNLADDPDAIEVAVEEHGDDVALMVHANPSDMGRLIGKRGRVIQALRQLVRAAGTADGVKANIDIVEQRGAPMTPAPGDRLVVGRVGRAHGLRGEVAVRFTSNRPERAEPGAVLYAGERELVIDAARPHQGRMLVHFAGVEDRSAAEALLGVELTAAPLTGDAASLGADEVWVHELVGAEVLDRAGTSWGCVVAVEANPAHDLLVLDGGALVPMVFVVEQHDGAVVIDPPDGLFDL